MNILHITEPFTGGVYEFLIDFTNALKEYRHFIVYGKREDTPDINKIKNKFPVGTDFIYWKYANREINPRKDFLALLELIRILKEYKNKVDIIHLHSSKAGFLGRIASKILGLSDKVVYTSHGVSFLRQDISNLKRKQFVLLEKFANKLGGTVVACSKSEAEEFNKYGINAFYIYNGINPITNFSKEYNKDKIIVGTMGRITHPKNPFIFNEVAKKFAYWKNIQFVWIGDGELKHQLTSKNIIITGWLDRKEALNKLVNIDIYLSTSLWEGLPLSVLQAMALKKPLVLSNCVGNRDLIVKEFNGFLCNDLISFEKNLYKLIKNENFRIKLGNNSYKLFNENFTLDRMIKNYNSLYEDILLRSTPSTRS